MICPASLMMIRLIPVCLQECAEPVLTCKRKMGPCDLLPPCNITNGAQTDTCYIPAPDGTGCILGDGFLGNGTCKDGECVE
jgi:hypothetical protein